MRISKGRGDYKQNSEENYDPGLQKLCHRTVSLARPFEWCRWVGIESMRPPEGMAGLWQQTTIQRIRAKAVLGRAGSTSGGGSFLIKMQLSRVQAKNSLDTADICAG